MARGGSAGVLAGTTLFMGLVIGIVAWEMGGIDMATLLVLGGITVLVLVIVGYMLTKSDDAVAGDLSAGIKTVAIGHAVGFYSDNSDDSGIYRLTFSVASHPARNIALFVPECVYRAVKRDDQVCIGFAPQSGTLLDLKTPSYEYIAGNTGSNADHGLGG